MGDLTDLNEFRRKKQEEKAGTECPECGHEWADGLWYYVHLNCPQCRLVGQAFHYKFEPDPEEKIWRCDCGNIFFEIMANGIHCPNCGVFTPVPIAEPT